MKQLSFTKKLKELKRFVIEIFVEEVIVVTNKRRRDRACMVTGKISRTNKEFVPGLFLSSQGVDILLEKLEEEKSNV